MARRDRWVRRWNVPSSSEEGRYWTVAIDRDGNWGCSCPAWRFRRQECHHIQTVKNSLGEGRQGEAGQVRVSGVPIESLG